jgi:hypothetical protein
MLLTGNPAGFFFVAQGGLGLCENTGCQISSAVMGLAGGLASFPAPSGAGASGISGAGSSGLGAAGIASGDISVGANSLSGALSLLGAGLTVRRVADDEGGGGPKWWWRLGRFVGPTMGFQSFPAFKRAFGPAGNDMEYHHIVLQTEQNIQRFGAWFIHNTRNIIPLPSRIHDRISAFYNSSIQPGGPLVREVVEQWDYIDQFNFGMEVVKRFGGAP